MIKCNFDKVDVHGIEPLILTEKSGHSTGSKDNNSLSALL